MNYTNDEKNLKNILSFYTFIFLVSCILTIYYFYIEYSTTHPVLLLTPPVLFMLFIFSAMGAGGIRKNNTFIDLLNISFILIAVVAAIKYFKSSGDMRIIYGSYFIISLLFYIITLYAWRKAVISRFGLKELSPTQALAYRALAEVVIADYKAEGYSFDTIVKDFDFYLSRFQTLKKLPVKLVYLAVQYFPIIYFRLPLTWMGVEDRKEFIEKRFYKATGQLLIIMRSAKQLIYFIYYGNKPSFGQTGYVMFEYRERYKEMPYKPEPEPLKVTYIEDSREIETDICVIGSGAGGAVAAYNIARNTGKKVTILEKGRYYVPQYDFTNIEPEMIGTLYKDGALEMTQDFDLAILQGNCLGGSTTINNGICFRTPHTVLDEWEKLGAKLDVNRLEKYFTTVEGIIGAVPLNLTKTNEGANRFFKGAEKLGLSPAWFTTNFGECGGCGYCNLGCRYNRKLSMLLNYLPLAVNEGVEIIVDAEVLKIKTNGKKAEKILCRNSNGKKFTVSAKHIVIAAGAVASSELLLKSGIKKNVGTRLSFNITTPMMAEFPDKINSFDGVQMCCYIKGDGYLVETTFNPPGASALIMQGWFSTLNKRMIDYGRFATAAPVVGSEPNGKVKLSLLGGSTVDYDMTRSDFSKLKEGMKTLCKVFLSAGAYSILPSSYDDIVINSESDIEKIDRLITKPESISLSSAHPQGGNPMSDNKELGVIDTKFKVHGFNNLYVCDASVFPTGVTVNPQLSIMGIANYAADIISLNI